ncbi:MAG TPA: two-component regulator propeller domain-containing protein [Thermoanaerobaculia bacterium]|nr:two-component regulator propeller domain-containing protein [Thermoanaerobaculia bacterium]
MAASGAAGLNSGTVLSQYGRDVWDGDSGLPQNSVDAILQTRDGYLWLGTQEGLVRFDGVRFSVFDSRNSPAIRDDWVRSLCEARDGTLWVGTAEGLLRSQNGRFDGWQPEGDVSRGAVTQLLETRDGALWAVTARGLVRLRGHASRLFEERDGLAIGQVTSIAEDSDGKLWVGGQNGLSRLEEERFVPVPLPSDSAPRGVTALVRDPKGGVWAGTRTGIFHAGAGRIESRAFPRTSQTAPAQVLYVDAEGSVWIGTTMSLLRYAGGRFEELTRENGGLSSGDVNAIFEDREGSLWIGTRDGGLNRLKDERIANYTVRQGLPEDHVWSVFEDRDETLWVGTADGSLSRLPRGKSRFEFFTNVGARIVAMDQDAAGDLWVGTRGQGLFRIRDRRVIQVGEMEGFTPTFVGAIRADRNGGVWIGTGTSGLYHWRDGRFTRYTQKDGLASNAIFCLYEDRAGELWVGTWGGGLSRRTGGGFVNLTTKEGLAHDIVMSVLEDARGDFWFGTRGGLSRWSHGRFTTFRQATGLFHDAVQSVMADDRGYLWMTSNRGIFRVRAEELSAATGSMQTLHPIGLPTGNGMRNVECNNGQHGGVRGKDGRLWFATLKGLAMADPTRIRLNTVPPQVVIEKVLAGRQEIELSGTGAVTVEPPTRDLEFRYTALSFRNPGAIRFRYRLEGFDRGWVEAEGRRTAYYTNLPPGRYRFRVLAGNEDGYWSVRGAAVEATLERSIPETAWFRFLVAAAVVLLAWSVHRLRARRLAAGEALRAAVLEARLSSLQSQLKPHFLFNALNSLLPLVGNEPTRARRMIVRIGDLLRASLMSETVPLVTLERDLLLLSEYLDVERMRFRDRISIEIDADERARAARVPSFLLQPLVENAIKHAADPVTGRVRIRVEARVESESLILKVSDDGPGVAPDFDRTGGIGLRNIRRRLDLLYPGEYDLYLANLGNPGGGPGGLPSPRRGCEVRIRLPLSLETETAEAVPGLRRARAGTP